ncbi:hypothetical protein KRX52_04465 [Pseudomonas sp. MAP12]|uniref:Uncharacterized protein n=1 Tax=Geopseudomonas aromaticivorans TaxID=2849492 RepID=A0ABS6MTB3_9GAMM|nr:hypothetical protein [Pseudomonas aromaticivorans]MBV2132050.1 hypothetical protein [Pseudomonas aromaticivorans]
MSQYTNSRELSLDGQPVIVREMTVMQVREWLASASADRPLDIVGDGLFTSCALADLPRMTDLTDERIDQLRPSQVEQVIAACKELNPHFFGMTERLNRALQSKA